MFFYYFITTYTGHYVSLSYFILFCYTKRNQKTKTEANYLILSINYVYKALLLPYAY